MGIIASLKSMVSGRRMTTEQLRSAFERVYVISLKRRSDRLRTFLSRLDAVGWPFHEPIIYEAIDGDKVGVPPEFTQGGGAYGCRMSHLRILQDCLMDDVQSVLMLEDDAEICDGFPGKVEQFLAKVPDDWEGIMLGGQHHAPPAPTEIPGIVRVRYCQRTHAYGARPSYMMALQRRWGNATVHIDWLMRDWQHQFKVYAPDPWLIGQGGGRSDIRGAEKAPEWWIRDTAAIPPGPVVVANVTAEVIEKMRGLGFHTGNVRDGRGIDVGLAPLFTESVSEENCISRLRGWIESIQAECVGGLIPTIWHPKARVEVVRKAWDGEVYEVHGDTADEALQCLPMDIQIKMHQRITIRQSPVVLLRCPMRIIGNLHSVGLHPGYYRDKKCGLDKGLMDIFDNIPQDQRLAKLKAWCELLIRQADKDGMIVTAVHPQLTREMLQAATDRRVIEIMADTVEDARRQILGDRPSIMNRSE